MSNEQGPEMGDMGQVAGEYVETVEAPTDEQIAAFMERGGEAPTFHPILKVWQAVLEPALSERDAKITPQWATRICATYQQLTFADMVAYQEAYYGKILELSAILDFEISTDDECLNYTTPEEDVEHNSHHYKNLLALWQEVFLGWEMDWDCTDAHAAVEIAAISEVHKMFFAQNGLTAFLDNIRFEYTEDDQADLAERLQAMKDGR